MTKREVYVEMLAILKGEERTIADEEMIATVEGYIEALNATNEKRKVKADEKRVEKEAEKAPVRTAIAALITKETPKTATTLIAESGLDLKPQTVAALLKPLVADGVVVKTEVKIKGKGKQVGYALA